MQPVVLNWNIRICITIPPDLKVGLLVLFQHCEYRLPHRLYITLQSHQRHSTIKHIISLWRNYLVIGYNQTPNSFMTSQWDLRYITTLWYLQLIIERIMTLFSRLYTQCYELPLRLQTTRFKCHSLITITTTFRRLCTVQNVK